MVLNASKFSFGLWVLFFLILVSLCLVGYVNPGLDVSNTLSSYGTYHFVCVTALSRSSWETGRMGVNEDMGFDLCWSWWDERLRDPGKLRTWLRLQNLTFSLMTPQGLRTTILCCPCPPHSCTGGFYSLSDSAGTGASFTPKPLFPTCLIRKTHIQPTLSSK